MTDDKFKDFKVTKLPAAGPRPGQSQNEYMSFRSAEAHKKFQGRKDSRSEEQWRRAYSNGFKPRGPKRK